MGGAGGVGGAGGGGSGGGAMGGVGASIGAAGVSASSSVSSSNAISNSHATNDAVKVSLSSKGMEKANLEQDHISISDKGMQLAKNLDKLTDDLVALTLLEILNKKKKDEENPALNAITAAIAIQMYQDISKM